MSEGCWQPMSEISADFILTGDFEYLPLTINPLDARTAYFWSTKRERLVYYNLHNGEFVIRKLGKGGSSGQITNAPCLVVNNPREQVYLKIPRDMRCLFEQAFSLPFVLPQWLHRIPKNTVRIKQPTTRGKETCLFENKRSFTIKEKVKVKALYKRRPVQSQQKPNVMNQLSSQQWTLQKDIPSKNRIHGKAVTATSSDAIKLSNPFEALDDLPE